MATFSDGTCDSGDSRCPGNLPLRTGEANLAIAPYTTDGDLALDPAKLAETPTLEAAALPDLPGLGRTS